MPSPNVYMTDEVYLGLVPKLCKGICEMQVFRDHKYWWCVWILDSFGYHVNVHIEKECATDEYFCKQDEIRSES